MKLNLGCGFDKREGWLNVDNFEACEPDRMLDIETTPWDLPTDGFEHVLMKHVLEHVGADFPTFRRVMQELYRILAPGGLLEIHVPHVRHDTFWSDPTHVRAFTPLTFTMMSKRQNREWMERRANYTMLAFALDVDFEVETIVQNYDYAWQAKLNAGEITREELREVANTSWNVARELQVRLRAVK
ncbi:methyltransferase domain-containing protein [Phenylobacterium sp.]|uniref:class I SAM-dependent methyltransferase n=1 Tax=Phenylobacterium sp. TaxID=1871053 RepID=UPI002810FCA9|nr:methyltransferase domain-containing protein [Phenylobacterium sp.]